MRHDRSFPRASSECVGSTRRGHFSFTLASNSLKADPACLRSLNEARRGRGPISRVCLATHTRELRCLRKWRIEQRYLADFRFDFGQTIILGDALRLAEPVLICNGLGSDSRPRRPYGGAIYSATRRSCLPSLRPSNSRRSVAGAFSRPHCTSTRYLILPACTQPASAPIASAARGM